MNQQTGHTPTYPDLKRIQALFSDLYTREALVALCHDTPDLQRLYAALSPTRGEADFIRQLVATAHRTNHLDRLLAIVQTDHPAYAQHAPYHTSESPVSEPADPQPASQPTPPLTEAEPKGGQPASGDRVSGDKITAGNIDAKGSAIAIGRDARAEVKGGGDSEK
jgi:hypothetical protein